MTATAINPIVNSSIAKKTNAINNNLSNRLFNKYLIITPAVSIDRSYNNPNSNSQYYTDDELDYTLQRNINNNYYCDRMNGSKEHLNRTMHTTTTNLLPKRSTTSASWRWCTLICSAIKCFGNNNGFTTATAAAAAAAAAATSYTTTSNTSTSIVSSGINSMESNEAHDKNQNVIYEL